jgi:hypothetical protein
MIEILQMALCWFSILFLVVYILAVIGNKMGDMD